MRLFRKGWRIVPGPESRPSEVRPRITFGIRVAALFLLTIAWLDRLFSRRTRIILVLLLLTYSSSPTSGQLKSAAPDPARSGNLTAAPQALAAHPSFENTVRPFFERHCLACHSDRIKTGGINFESYTNSELARQNADLFKRALRKLRSGEMPPAPMPRPAAHEVQAVVSWLEDQFGKLEDEKDPGRVTARRLNRIEYDNTVHDLLGIDFHPADDFPADDIGYGFDNNGDVLSLSPILLEKYLSAAEKIAATIIPDFSATQATSQQYLTKGLRHEVIHDFPVRGEYELFVNVVGKRPKTAPPQTLTISLDGKTVASFPVESSKIDTGANLNPGFEVRLKVDPGKRKVAAGLYAEGEEPADIEFDREVRGLDMIVVRGPFNPEPEINSNARRLFVCGHPYGKHEPACATQILAALARRAYRRPVTGEEVDRLAGFAERAEKQGRTFEEGIRLALEAVLVSPHFLFRIEQDPNPTDASAAHSLTDHELATRLSYFLWSSMPDEHLLQLADEHRLRQPEVFGAEVDRMLADPRSTALADNFAGQWLKVRSLDTIKPDPDRFPKFDDELRKAMREETRLFFQTMLGENRSIVDFIDGKFTFLNERLARHYGITSVRGPAFRRVEVAGRQRSGIITQASVLTVASYPTRTSPVLRGKWILENILYSPPPSPPPDTPNLNESGIGTKTSLRQQLEKHRASPICASCHAPMDPLGFGLENYNAIGEWRTRDGEFAVDCTGTLPDGRSFRTPAELKTILRADPTPFARGLTQKMLTYALGRGLESYDDPVVNSIVDRLSKDGYRFRNLVREIANSAPFQMRRGEKPKS